MRQAQSLCLRFFLFLRGSTAGTIVTGNAAKNLLLVFSVERLASFPTKLKPLLPVLPERRDFCLSQGASS